MTKGITLMILAMATLTLTMMNSSSPLKASLMVCTTSVVLSMMFYTQTNSLFPSSVLIISFSSGMMVLFCYCASLCSYEISTKSPMTSYLMTMVMIMLSMSTMTFKQPTQPLTTTNSIMKGSMMQNSSILLVLMMILILTMTAINVSIFNPQKKMIKSY